MDKRHAVCLTVKHGQHIDLSDGTTLYVSAIKGRAVRIVIIARPELRIARTNRFGSQAWTEEEFFRRLREGV